MTSTDNPDPGSQRSGKEQRRHERHSVDIEAGLSSASFSSLPCRITDYCRGGMFLAWSAGPGSGLQPGEPLTIELTLAAAGHTL